MRPQILSATFKNSLLLFLVLAGTLSRINAQSVAEYDQRGDRYFKNKQYSLAITEWIKALEIDPDNVEIQEKIESVFEEKKKKDIAVQVVKKNLREIKGDIEKGMPERGKSKSEEAVRNFIIAYRIDPNDPELQPLRNRVTRLRTEIDIEIERQRLSRESRQKYDEYHRRALELRQAKDFENAIVWYDKMLTIFPNDTIAKQGKYESNLALQSRLKYEKIRQYLDKGIELYNAGDFSNALNEFREVIRIDPGNPDADSYIAKIDDKLEAQYDLERRRTQAEQFYQSGNRNIASYNFDDAREDYETVLSLIDNYKDAKARLALIDQQKTEYRERMKKEILEKINQEFQNGLLHLTQSEYREAISSFEKILEYDPKNELAARYISTAKEALELERQDIIDPESPYYAIVRSLENSGKLYFEAGQYNRSLEQWERILKLFPNNAMATEYLLKCQLKLNPDIFHRFAREQIEQGKKLIEQKQYQRALRKFEIIKSISPDYPQIDELIAGTNETKPKIPEVIAAAVIRTPLPPNTPRATPAEVQQHYDQGMNYFRQGGRDNIMQALREFRWVAQNDPENVRAIININNIESQLRLGSAAQSAPAKKTLSDNEKELVRKYYLNGINYYTNNKFPEAITEWRKVLSIDPDHQKAKNNIRKCLLLMEQ